MPSKDIKYESRGWGNGKTVPQGKVTLPIRQVKTEALKTVHPMNILKNFELEEVTVNYYFYRQIHFPHCLSHSIPVVTLIENRSPYLRITTINFSTVSDYLFRIIIANEIPVVKNKTHKSMSNYGRFWLLHRLKWQWMKYENCANRKDQYNIKRHQTNSGRQTGDRPTDRPTSFMNFRYFRQQNKYQVTL